jgi:hypothetical protein
MASIRFIAAIGKYWQTLPIGQFLSLAVTFLNICNRLAGNMACVAARSPAV